MRAKLTLDTHLITEYYRLPLGLFIFIFICCLLLSIIPNELQHQVHAFNLRVSWSSQRSECLTCPSKDKNKTPVTRSLA